MANKSGVSGKTQFLALTLFEASITLVYLVGSIGRVVGIMLVSIIIKLLLSVSIGILEGESYGWCDD